MNKHCTTYSTKVKTFSAPGKSRPSLSKHICNFFTLHKTSQEAERALYLLKNFSEGRHRK